MSIDNHDPNRFVNRNFNISYSYTQPWKLVDPTAQEAYNRKLEHQAVERELARLDALENVVDILNHEWVGEYLKKK